MNKSSLCALVLAINTASCFSKTAYTPPSEVITRYITIPRSCPPPRTVIEHLPCEQKTEEKKVDSITLEYRALLNTLAWAEGTDCHYNMMVGRMLFTNYVSHPVETGEMPKKGIPFPGKRRVRRNGRWITYSTINYSTAAGRFQFLYRTYLTLKNEEGLFQSGFNPEEQDKAGKYLADKQGVTQELLEEAIRTKNFTELWNQLSWTWASIPCDESKKPRRERRICYPRRGRYNQFTYPDKDLQKIYFIFYDAAKK